MTRTWERVHVDDAVFLGLDVDDNVDAEKVKLQKATYVLSNGVQEIVVRAERSKQAILFIQLEDARESDRCTHGSTMSTCILFLAPQ